MSYLDNIRLVFTGKFQADVSTVNNDVRHFDNATFDPGFQKFMAGPVWNGWWNPTGSGAFRLINCRVMMVGYHDGSTATGDDAAIGMRIAASENHTSGKIVDIDPQWQLASALWGLDVRLTDGKEPGFFSGHYRPHAFRDLWFGRMLSASGAPGGGDGAASATFQSVLENVAWKDLKGSRVLTELKAAATDGLSIRLTTFSYIDKNPNGPDFTLGTVTGVIGPQCAGDPKSFILGRRFAPANGITSWNGCGYSVGRVDAKARRLFVDLSNGLQLALTNNDPTKGPIVPVGSLNDIGTLRIGILKNADVTEFTPATEDNFLSVGEIDYQDDGWLLNTSGIAAFPLDDTQLALLADHPLALAAEAPLNAGTGANGKFGQIAIRETSGGLFVDAEPIVHRIDAPENCTSTIYAARYGAPLANAQVAISQLGRMPQQGGGQGAGPNTPTAPIPDIGVPESAFKIPATVITDPDGTAQLTDRRRQPGQSAAIHRRAAVPDRLPPAGPGQPGAQRVRLHRHPCARRLHGAGRADLGEGRRADLHPIRQPLSDHEQAAREPFQSARRQASRKNPAAGVRPADGERQLHAGDARPVARQVRDDPQIPRSRDRRERADARGGAGNGGACRAV